MNEKLLENTSLFDIKREQTVIIQCAMDILEATPKISTKDFCVKLSQSEELKRFHKDFFGMKRSTAEHYKYCAIIFNRLLKALDKRVIGYEIWHEDDFSKLLSTGIMLCDAAFDLIRIRSEESFLYELKKVVEILHHEPYPNNIKAIITNHVKKEIGKMDSSELNPKKHRNHDEIVYGPGKDKLRNLGCGFVTTEAVLEKKDAKVNKKGLRLDVYGWRDDTSVVGIEIKTKLSDFEEAFYEGRFERYLDYCTEFYIMTTKNSVFKEAKRWCSHHKAAGAILIGEETLAIKDETTLKTATRKTTPKILQKMHDVFTAKMIKLINTTYFSPTVTTPSVAREQILGILSNEIEIYN